MTFSYNPFVTDKDRVRFNIGDTDSNTAFLTDEEITAIIADSGNWQPAVIVCLQYMLQKIALVPKFSNGWLTVSSVADSQSIRELLKQKRREFGLPEIQGDTINTYRVDSAATESPDFEDMKALRGIYS
jgi:hypothetical protein